MQSSMFLLGQIFSIVQMWEECRFTDEPRLLARVFTGSVRFGLHDLEHAQWGPAPFVTAEVLR